MRSLCLLMFAALSACLVSNANADIYKYSWSGFLEDFGPTNPWGLGGDGSLATNNDGSAFTINVFVNSAAVDVSTSNNIARFDVSNTTEFYLDGSLLQITSGTIFFEDSTFDRIGFDGFGTRLGTNMGLRTIAFIPSSAFEVFNDNSADLPPMFLSTSVVSNSLSSVGTIASWVPNGASVTVTAVPEPCVAGTLLVAMVGAPMWKRLRKNRKS